MNEPRLEDWEVQVVLNVNTTREDLPEALRRSGIVAGELIGETLIEDVVIFA